MDLQITCIVPDGPDPGKRIDGIGGDIGGVDGGPWRMTIEQAIAGVESGEISFFTKADGLRAEVVVKRRDNGTKYLKSRPDRSRRNNLLNQTTCD